jgi:hypothetical protein
VQISSASTLSPCRDTMVMIITNSFRRRLFPCLWCTVSCFLQNSVFLFHIIVYCFGFQQQNARDILLQMHLQLQQSHVQLWSRTNKPKHCYSCSWCTRCEYLQLPTLPLGLRYNTSSILVFTGKTYVPRDSPHICRLKLHIHHPQSLQGHNSSDEAVTNVRSEK